MKSSGILCLLTITLALYNSNKATGQVCDKPLGLFNKINEIHIQPRILDDSLSKKIYEEIFFQLDPNQDVLLTSDIGKLSLYQFQLDSEIKGRSCKFVTLLKENIEAVFNRKREILDSLFEKPFTFQEDEYYDLPIKLRHPISKSKNQLINRIKAEIKYQVFLSINQKVGFEKITDMNVEHFERMLPSALAKVKTKMYRDFERQAQYSKEKNFAESIFLKAIARVFDPHTEYLSNKEMTRFNDELSSEKLSFGFDLNETSMGEIKIVKIIPGGPAWKSGKFHKGDQLIKIQFDNEIPVDVMDLEIEEIENLLNSPNKVIATLTTLTANQEIVESKLTKAKIINTENTIFSYLLKSKDFSFGYIQLPGFFSSENGNGKNGCANEVAKEIIRLNKLKAQGLILDLRFNGGGHINEAVELAGIFIDAGPLAIMEERGGEQFSIKDLNRGQAFFGPLVILVNGYSASASEFVSASLQDYQRAILVGGTTFGKSTGQIILPLKEGSKEDFIKTTVHKIYRINQSTAQYTGVTPDIQLPDICDIVEQKEKNYNNPLRFETAQKKTYYTKYPKQDIDSLKLKSAIRIKSNNEVLAIQNLVQVFKSPLSLKKESLCETINRLIKATSKLKEIASEPIYQVKVVDNDSDPFRLETALQVIPELISSGYIKEAFNILVDIQKMKKP